MDYKLENATKENIEYLKKAKLASILDYAGNFPKEELVRINNYVNKCVPLEVNEYKVIKVDRKTVGCLLVCSNDDGVLLDEIYLDKEYRGKGIGSSLIKVY